MFHTVLQSLPLKSRKQTIITVSHLSILLRYFKMVATVLPPDLQNFVFTKGRTIDFVL